MTQAGEQLHTWRGESSAVPGGGEEAARPRQGMAFVALGALGFSSIILFTRLIRGMGALSIAFYRALFSFLFFTALLIVSQHSDAFRPQRYRRDLPYLVGLGISVGITGILYIYAVQHTTAAAATLLNNTSVVYVALLAPLLLKETRQRTAWVSLSLAMAGMLCIANPNELASLSISAKGTAAATLSGLSYAGTMLFSRALRGRVTTMVQAWWSMGIAAVLASPWIAQAGTATVLPNIGYLAALGIVAQGIPYTLYFLGLQHATAQMVSLVALLEPVTGILLGILVFQEMPGAWGTAGIVLIVCAIVLASRRPAPPLPIQPERDGVTLTAQRSTTERAVGNEAK